MYYFKSYIRCLRVSPALKIKRLPSRRCSIEVSTTLLLTLGSQPRMPPSSSTPAIFLTLHESESTDVACSMYSTSSYSGPRSERTFGLGPESVPCSLKLPQQVHLPFSKYRLITSGAPFQEHISSVHNSQFQGHSC